MGDFSWCCAASRDEKKKFSSTILSFSWGECGVGKFPSFSWGYNLLSGGEKGHLLNFCVLCIHKIIMRCFLGRNLSGQLTQTYSYVRSFTVIFRWQMFPFFSFTLTRSTPQEPLNRTTIYSNSKSHSATLKKCV